MSMKIVLLLFGLLAVCNGQSESKLDCPDFPKTGLGATTKDGTPLHLSNPRQNQVEEIRDGLYWVTDGTYTNMFLVGDEGVFLVDAPPSLMDASPNLVEAIKSVTDKPITHLILSHYHSDHIGAGLNVLEGLENVTVIAQEATRKLLEEALEDEPLDTRPVVTSSFTDMAWLSPDGTFTVDKKVPKDFKGLVLSSTNFHTEGDLFVYAPFHKTLCVIDLVFPGYVPGHRFPITRRYLKANDDVLEFDFDVLVAGHFARLGTRKDASRHKAFVLDVKKAAQEALRNVSQEPSSKEACVLWNLWSMESEVREKTKAACKKSVLEKWKDDFVLHDLYVEDMCDAFLSAVTED